MYYKLEIFFTKKDGKEEKVNEIHQDDRTRVLEAYCKCFTDCHSGYKHRVKHVPYTKDVLVTIWFGDANGNQWRYAYKFVDIKHIY